MVRRGGAWIRPSRETLAAGAATCWGEEMQLLVLGGTAFLGREVARQAVARGWEVTCAARSRSGSFPDGVRGVVLDRDHHHGLEPLTGRRWDAVVDLARQPGQVRRAVRDLTTRHWVFVSTANVYADQATGGQDESGTLLPPLDADAMTDPAEYGPAKVACENLVRGTASSTIARAGLIVGPGDVSGRLGYWPWRFARETATPVVIPDDPDQPVQLIDVGDLAAWLLDCAEGRVDGVFNAAGTPTTLGQVLDAARTTAGHRGPVLAAPSDWLVGHGVTPWMGERSLPLWLGGDHGLWGFQSHRNDRALASGLRLRPLEDTLVDVRARETWRGTDPRAAGLDDAAQAELVRALREDIEARP